MATVSPASDFSFSVWLICFLGCNCVLDHVLVLLSVPLIIGRSSHPLARSCFFIGMLVSCTFCFLLYLSNSASRLGSLASVEYMSHCLLYHHRYLINTFVCSSLECAQGVIVTVWRPVYCLPRYLDLHDLGLASRMLSISVILRARLTLGPF